MYATWKRKEVLTHVVTDRETLMQGIAVTRRDGTTDLLQRDELNLPLRQYYKLYYQKVHNRPPFLLFQAFNRTLGLEPDDPDFIVGITVPMELMHRHIAILRVPGRNLALHYAKLKRIDIEYAQGIVL